MSGEAVADSPRSEENKFRSSNRRQNSWSLYARFNSRHPEGCRQSMAKTSDTTKVGKASEQTKTEGNSKSVRTSVEECRLLLLDIVAYHPLLLLASTCFASRDESLDTVNCPVVLLCIACNQVVREHR